MRQYQLIVFRPCIYNCVEAPHLPSTQAPSVLVYLSACLLPNSDTLRLSRRLCPATYLLFLCVPRSSCQCAAQCHAGDLNLLKEHLDDPASTGILAGMLGAENDGSEPLLPTSQYLSLTRDWKPPVEMYQPGSGVTIIAGAAVSSSSLKSIRLFRSR
jgi:hypothetical protein